MAQAEGEDSAMAGTKENTPKMSKSLERNRLRSDSDEARDRGMFLTKLVNYYAEKFKVGSEDKSMWIFRRLRRDMAKEDYDVKIKCEKCTYNMSTLVGMDKQAKK